MSSEKELKYLIGLHNIRFETIIEILKKEGLMPSYVGIENQINTYFDTPSMELYSSKCTARIRDTFDTMTKKHSHEFTYKSKSVNTSPNSFLDRTELNVPFDSRPTLSQALEAFRKKYPEVILPEGLREIGTLKNNREVYNISSDSSLTEVAFDTPCAVLPGTAEEISMRSRSRV